MSIDSLKNRSNKPSDQQPLVSVVCPFFNENDGIDSFFSAVVPILDALPATYELICIDDGSTDSTLQALTNAASNNAAVKVIELSRNFGKESAITAGIDHSAGDAVVIIDADLQDPPHLITEMYEQWACGFEVVLAKRSDRSVDSLPKRLSANLFYKLLNHLGDTSIPENVGDCRLMDRQVVDALKQLPENRRFMKGLMSWVGFRTTTISYTRSERSAGKSKFSGWRLWNFALEGITAFSTVPLRIWTYLGLFFSIVAFSYACFIIFHTLVMGIEVPGYASLLTVVLFLGGIQLIGLGILGEYVGRIYSESKRRPVYFVRRIVEPGKTTNDS